jgi:hypothetical protein
MSLSSRCRGGLAVVAFLFLSSALRADDLQSLGRDFWAWRAENQPLNGDDVPRLSRPRGWSPDWSAAAVASRRQDLERFAARWKVLARPQASVSEQVDHRLLGSALARVRWELDGVRLWRRDPGFYVAQTLGAFTEALLPPPPFEGARSDDLVALLGAFPRIFESARVNLDQAVPDFAALALSSLDGAGPHLREAVAALKPLLDIPHQRRLEEETGPAVAAIDSYRAWLQEKSPGMKGPVALGRDAYVRFLREVALLPYTPEQILEMGRQEWARSVASEVLEARRNRAVPELPIFPDQAAQMERARRDELAIRRFLGERGILTVPGWISHYQYLPMPPYLAPLADYGEGTDFPLKRRPDEHSTRYIPKPSPSLGYFALSMARDPRADMVHEGIPGHGFQLALSRHQEDEIRQHWYDSTINEGLGFYCEEMMLTMGLFDDSPRSREMIWNYARLRALRVEVDVQLALGTFTVDQAAEYLRTAVPMDESTAKAEAASFAASPGFAIGYQIGKLQIEKFLADARRQKGEHFDLQAFDDRLWRNGNVPVVLQRWEVLGEKDELNRVDGSGAP